MADKLPFAPAENIKPIPPPEFGCTDVICPNCGHRTGISIRRGAIVVFCFKCKAKTRVTIDVIAEAAVRGPSCVSDHESTSSSP